MTKIVARHFTSKLAFSEGWRFGGFWRSAVGNSALSATAASLSGTHFELDFEHFLRLRLENFSHFELASPSTYSFCCTFHTWNLSFLLQSEHHDGEFSVFSCEIQRKTKYLQTCRRKFSAVSKHTSKLCGRNVTQTEIHTHPAKRTHTHTHTVGLAFLGRFLPFPAQNLLRVEKEENHIER